MPVFVCGARRIAIARSGTFVLPFVIVASVGSTASSWPPPSVIRYCEAMWSAICFVMAPTPPLAGFHDDHEGLAVWPGRITSATSPMSAAATTTPRIV